MERRGSTSKGRVVQKMTGITAKSKLVVRKSNVVLRKVILQIGKVVLRKLRRVRQIVNVVL